MATFDHLISKVNDLEASVAFYTGVLGFTDEGKDGSFTVIRVSHDFTLQLAPWGTPGFEHYAFALSKIEFEDIFNRIKAAGIPFGPSFHAVGLNTEPGEESGARGMAPAIYFNVPQAPARDQDV